MKPGSQEVGHEVGTAEERGVAAGQLQGLDAPQRWAQHREFPDRGHSLTIDHGWRDVADAVLHWLKEKGL